MKYLYNFLLTLLFLLFEVHTSNSQIIAGQIDTFDESTENWERGTHNSGQLELIADGQGLEGKLVTFNQTQWSGNYLIENITFIRLTISNPSEHDLSMRIAIGNATNATSGTWYSSSSAVNVISGIVNQTIDFPISEENMTLVSGSDSYIELMNNVTTLRILHNPSPSAQGINIIASIYIDNIEALEDPMNSINNLTPGINIYPNPAKDKLHFANISNQTIYIYDITGKLFTEIETTSNFKEINISNWASGIYIIQIKSQGKIISKRLMIE